MNTRDDEIRRRFTESFNKANAMLAANKTVEAAGLFNETLTQLESLSQFTATDWSCLNSCLEHFKKSYEGPLSAIASLKANPNKSEADWRKLAIYQNIAGYACQDSEQKYKWYQESIASLNNVKKLTEEDWRNLAIYQRRLGTVYKDINDWKQAMFYFMAALDSSAKSRSIVYSDITDIYSKLNSMVLPCSLEGELFSFALNVFQNSIEEVENKFQKLHLSITEFNKSTNLLHGLHQLMKLIDIGINENNFPNAAVTKWLNDKKKHDQFKRLMEPLEKFVSLLDTTTQAPNTLVAMAAMILDQEQQIQTLNAEIRKLQLTTAKQDNSDLTSAGLFKTPSPQR